MRCPVCDKKEWKNVDHVRLKKSDMEQCQGCGYISYPKKYKSEEEIKAHYRTEYRPGPQASALFTGERKLQYHSFFLNNLFKEWEEKGKDTPVIGEIGCATGMFLNWVRDRFPQADIHGTELTETYRLVAFHEFGLKLAEEFDTSKKYDLIASYHVLEHQIDPDLRLAEYAACLKDDGLFYLSAPVWFRDGTNSATGGFDIEYYWAPDHINCWAEEHLEFIIAKAGLEIIYKNDDIYGNTYLLKKTTKTTMRPSFDVKKYLNLAERIFKCWQLINENKTTAAIETFPNCPSAWINHYELNRANFHKSREEFDKFIKMSVDCCPNSSDTLMFAGDVLSRYERYDESYECLTKALNKKPNNPTIIMGLSNCYRMKAKKSNDPKVKEELLRKSINLLRFVIATSTEMMPQAISWIYQDEAQLEVPL